MVQVHHGAATVSGEWACRTATVFADAKRES